MRARNTAMALATVMLGNAGPMRYDDALDRLPRSLQPVPGSGRMCPHCSRKFGTTDGYIRHVIEKHGDK